eukprot:TRINITY_DN33228_c0_g1_i10.p3 TRINITY_DN33228_c0_g1~~TRINITY_DN33228_c0_g1_i10.p3  ORF type:complete len:163 (-),score=24.42 TRINITY_DN33228_c0_g1_i10:281-769(-)
MICASGTDSDKDNLQNEDEQLETMQNKDKQLEAKKTSDVPQMPIISYPYKQEQQKNSQVESNFSGFAAMQNQNNVLLPENAHKQISSQYESKNSDVVEKVSNQTSFDADPFGLDELQQGLPSNVQQPQNTFDPFNDVQNVPTSQNNLRQLSVQHPEPEYHSN